MSDYAITKTDQPIAAQDYSANSKVECFCDVCKEPVTFVRAHGAVLRGGTEVYYRAAFRHRPDSACVVNQRDQETEQHLNMKAAWIKAYPSAKTEVPLPSGRRADLVVTTTRGRQFSVECQHSIITPETVRGRFTDHNQDGLFVDFNFSSRRLKNYQLSLNDGVFDAIDASAFRTIELSEFGEASQTWVFFDMHYIDNPMMVKAARDLKDIALVGVVDRGYQVIAPENDLDLLRWHVKGKMDSLRGAHESFLENWDRAKAGYDDPIVAMKRWQGEARSRMSFTIPANLPGSQLRSFCAREDKKLKAAEALKRRAMAQAEQGRWNQGRDQRREDEQAQRTAEMAEAEQGRHLVKWDVIYAQTHLVDALARQTHEAQTEASKQQAYKDLARHVDAALAASQKSEAVKMLGVFRSKLAEAVADSDESGILIYGGSVARYTKQVATELAAEVRKAAIF